VPGFARRRKKHGSQKTVLFFKTEALFTSCSGALDGGVVPTSNAPVHCCVNTPGQARIASMLVTRPHDVVMRFALGVGQRASLPHLITTPTGAGDKMEE
jgi:hypothetical protein